MSIDHDGHGGRDQATDAGHAGHDAHAGHAGHDMHAHAAQFRRLFWIMLAIAVPTVALSPMFASLLGYHLPGMGTGGGAAQPGTASAAAAWIGWVSPVLGTVMYVWGGRPFLTGGWSELRSRKPGMMLLIGLAITVAFLASWAARLGFVDHGLDFWWELALLIVIMLLGHWIEMRSIAQAGSALDSLAALLPDEAERVEGEVTVRIPPAELAVDDVVVVRPGGRIPADGVIVSGEASVDESMITGESAAVRRRETDAVVAGTVATDSGLRIRVTAVGDDTTLAGIGRLVAQAQASSSRAQRIADRAAAWLFWYALGAAIVTALVWSLIGLPDDAVTRTITVLVIACPHALGLAIPLVVSIATERAARSGVLITDRLALETMRTVDTIVFDKTGTLTEGAPALVAVRPVAAAGADAGSGGRGDDAHAEDGAGGRGDAVDADELLALAAAAEADSEHPLARAIVAAASERGLDVPAAAGFASSPAVGVSATVDGETVRVGGPRMLREQGIPAPETDAAAGPGGDARPGTASGPAASAPAASDPAASAPDAAAASGSDTDDSPRRAATVLYVVRSGRMLGSLALADRVRAGSRDALDRLRASGVEPVMITGDAAPVAREIAEELGITRSEAEVRPEDKARIVERLRGEGRRVAMVGDGVNDAPALAAADVGIAIGAGTDVAIASAGVVFASSDPRAVLTVTGLSRATYRKMVQNLWWAAGYNLLAVPLAAGVLAPIGFVLPMSVGAILMSLSTVIVALNAQLLRRSPRTLS